MISETDSFNTDSSFDSSRFGNSKAQIQENLLKMKADLMAEKKKKLDLLVA